MDTRDDGATDEFLADTLHLSCTVKMWNVHEIILCNMQTSFLQTNI